MRVDTLEYGNRPAFMTRARMNAPQAVSRLTDLLAAADWADDAGVVLDWQGDFGWPKENGPMPVDLMQPIVYIGVHKAALGDHLKVEVRVTVEDTFSGDDILNEDLMYIIDSLKDTVLERVAARKEGRLANELHSN